MTEPKQILREPLWEKQFGESKQSFAAFSIYRDLGLKRTLDDAFRSRPGAGPDPKKAPGQWGIWSMRWQWVARAEAWDAHIDAEQRSAQEEAARKAGAEHAQRVIAQQDIELQARDKLLQRVNEMLMLPVIETTTQTDPVTGRAIQIIKPGKWGFGDVVRALALVSQLGRLSLGMETSRASIKIDAAEEIRKIARERGWDEEAAVQAVRDYLEDHAA